MTALGLDSFQKTKDYFIGIDSDGCAFDSMEIKHKECFIPAFIEHFDLQPVSKFAREAAEFTNLYSKSRGLNRFRSYLMALDLLEQWPDVQKREATIPKVQGLRDWVAEAKVLGNPTLQEKIAETEDADLKRSLEWSLDVNRRIAQMVHGVPPFPSFRQALQTMNEHADCIVCSATPNEALLKEWQEHDLADGVQAICGQESGKKAQSLSTGLSHGYDTQKTLMIGDAPGDMDAAMSVGCLYYPINPGAEEESWVRFNEEALGKFLDGSYAGAYQEQVIAEFQEYLPEKMHWEK